MKRISIVVAVLGSMTFPVMAGILPGDRSTAALHEKTPPSHFHRASQDVAFDMPPNARSFVANASFYGGGPRRFEPNTHTASGERFNQWGLTAAHRSLPLGTRLLVTHRGRSVVVRVNDRGPAAWTGRSLDLSRGAATAIGLIASGAGPVQVRVLSGG